MYPYDRPAGLSALEAKSQAQHLAFAPIAFQATVALVRLGILARVAGGGSDGVSAAAIAEELRLSTYGVSVLLDMGLSAQLVWQRDDGGYVLDKVGHFVLEDRMTRVNMDFVQDVCYQGMFHLKDAVKSGRPSGLSVFGDWKTIYPWLSALPDQARGSWFRFDHYYSDPAFCDALPLVFASKPQRLLDVGGNTGKWATQCVDYDQEVKVTIVDLPEQIELAMSLARESGRDARIDGHGADLLDPASALPSGADVIWMSQFLDCFSDEQIVSILERAIAAMDAHTSLYILEPFWDRQRYEAAAHSINATSLYFTCIANGNSRMFHSAGLLRLIDKVGLTVVNQHDQLGQGHTLLHCRRGDL